MKHSQNDGVAQMVVVFTIKEMSYLVVGLFNDLVGTYPIYWIFVTLSFLAGMFALTRPWHEKGPYLFQES